MFEINATLPIFLLMFWLFTIALDKMVLKPVGRVIALRQGKIQENIEAGSVARASAAEVVADYQKRLHSVRSQAQDLINDVVNQSQKHRQDQLKKVQDEAQSRLQSEKASITGERVQLLDKLIDEERVLVETITKKLIGEKPGVALDSARVRRALEDAS